MYFEIYVSTIDIYFGMWHETLHEAVDVRNFIAKLVLVS
jgi:hypothetical protein